MSNSTQPKKLNAICYPLPQAKLKYGTVLTKDACDIFRFEARMLNITQSQLLETLANVIHEPRVQESLRQHLGE